MPAHHHLPCPTRDCCLLFALFFGHVTLSSLLSFIFPGVSVKEMFNILLLFIVMVNPKAQRSLSPCLGNFCEGNLVPSVRVLKNGRHLA